MGFDECKACNEFTRNVWTSLQFYPWQQKANFQHEKGIDEVAHGDIAIHIPTNSTSHPLVVPHIWLVMLILVNLTMEHVKHFKIVCLI